MKSSAVVILLLGICLGTTGLVHAQDLQITPSDLGWTQLGSGAYLGSYLYRDVAVGESETATFTFESMGPTAVWGYTMGLVESTDPSDSSFTTPIGLGFPDYPAPSGAIWDYTLGAFSLFPMTGPSGMTKCLLLERWCPFYPTKCRLVRFSQ